MSENIESIKLKPCPSCGEDLASVRYHDFGCHHIECNKCHMQTSEYGGNQSASVWNDQPEMERLQQENAELRDILQKTVTAIYSHNNEMVGMHAVMNCASEAIKMLNKND